MGVATFSGRLDCPYEILAMRIHQYRTVGCGTGRGSGKAQPYLRFEEKPRVPRWKWGDSPATQGDRGRGGFGGAVHIGDAAYYQQLNKEFKAYEAVLYEMVKPAKLDPAQFKNRPLRAWV